MILRPQTTALLILSCAATTSALPGSESTCDAWPIVASDADVLFVTGEPPPNPPPTIRIVPHSVWESLSPKGTEADGMRRNLGVGDSETFKTFTITVTALHPGAFDTLGRPVISPNDKVSISYSSGEVHDERMANEGSAFNFEGFHIQIPAIHGGRSELGSGLTVIEVATIASLPPGFSESTTAGTATRRLRVPHDIDKLTLHHSNSSHLPGDALAPKLRSMQSWGETHRKWWDIPYHYMVDLDGTVFQARDHRFAGDTNTRYDPRGHFLINCFGNYDQAQPNEAQLATIANLMAWAAIEFGIEPLEIYGHRDLAPTTCPGSNLYRFIEDGTIRAMVEQVMEAGQPTIEWVESVPSP